MQRDDETPDGSPDAGSDAPHDPERARTHRRFAEVIAGLRAEDPRFVRRFSAPPPGRLRAGDVMIAVGLVATVLFGLLPLGIGLHTQVAALLALGAAGCVALPVIAPLLTRVVLGRARPLWT